MLTIILAIVLFVLLIFPHELGHFVAAKAVGVRVNEFAFGMGPALYKKQGRETLYSIRAFPVGGYCAMEGENEESDEEDAFVNKPAWARITVLVAGSAMNVLIAILVLSIMFGVIGAATTTVDRVQKGMPAAEAGLSRGDRIVSVDGREIQKWSDLSTSLSGSDDTRSITVTRNGTEKTLYVTPVKQDSRYVIGITPMVTHSPLLAVRNGITGSWSMTRSLFGALKQLATGHVKADDLSGPVGMVSLVHQTEKAGLINFFYLVALISLNLAIFNMLPFPALDGGRILFVIIRLFTGKAITDRQEAAVHGAGMALLLLLMIFVTWNDIERLLT